MTIIRWSLALDKQGTIISVGNVAHGDTCSLMMYVYLKCGLKADSVLRTLMHGHLFLQQNPYNTITSLQLHQPPDISSHDRMHTPQL